VTGDTQPLASASRQSIAEPGAAAKAVLDMHGASALATRIHIPERVVQELRRDAKSQARAGELRMRIRQAGRDRSAWGTDLTGRLTLTVPGFARCRLDATPLVDRDVSRPCGWLLIVERCELFPAQHDEPAVTPTWVLDVTRDVDADPLRHVFASALSEVVHANAIEKAVTVWLAEVAASWTLEPLPTGPRDLHLVRIAGGLDICIEALAGGQAPLRARFERPAPDPGGLLALLVPHLAPHDLALGPDGIPAALRYVCGLAPDAADRLLGIVAERVDAELRRLSPVLLSGLDLSGDSVAVCERRWQVGAREGVALVGELLTRAGASVTVDRDAGIVPAWTVTAPLVTAWLRLPVTADRLVVDALEPRMPPDNLSAEQFAYCDDAFAPWTLIEVTDDVVDEVVRARGDRPERRRRLERALRRVGRLHAVPETATARIDIGTTLSLMAHRADTCQPRLRVTHIQTPLAPLWPKYRASWLLTVTFMPGVRESVLALLGLEPDADPWRPWAALEPRYGIDHPPGGRPDVSLWVTFDVPSGSEAAAASEAHLALVADPSKLWGSGSMLAVGFVADESLGLPAPEWLRNPHLAMPSLLELAAEGRQG
jgi:hypothetical protein